MKRENLTKDTINLFWYHATRYKRFLIPMLIFIPIAVLILDFLLPFIIASILEKISTGAYDPQDLWGSFGKQIMLYAAASFASGLFCWRFNNWLAWKLELNVVRDIAHRVFVHLMKMSASFHANRFAGSLVSQANKLTSAYVRFFDETIYNLYTLTIAMIAAIVILTPRVPEYALVLVTMSAAYIAGTIYLSKPVRDANLKESQAESEQTGNLADSITNVMAIKSFARHKFEEDRYWKTTGKTKSAGHQSMRKTLIRETFSSSITTSIGIAAVIVAVVGAKYSNFDIATLFLMVSYTSAIGMRLWDFQNVMRQYNRALGDASDMVKILQIEPDIKDPAQPEESRIVRGTIELKDVTFAHDESNEPLFLNLNLRIKAGEKIGLVGHSGSGKTTLTKLLLRFSDVNDGAVLIDGQDIRNITQDELRSHISYVPQEPLLFHRSLAENIAYGHPDASQKEIVEIAKLANASEFIDQLPKGYETLVGERGVKLSGGQRQRVAIARAMIKNAPILVLDEATSALDSESEELIQSALWRLMEGRTALVIAHRLSTVQRMDRIVVLDNGKIVEQGSHKELVRLDGTYAKLWKRQSGGFLEE